MLGCALSDLSSLLDLRSMADKDLSQLERRYRASGSPADLEAWQRALQRSGLLPPVGVLFFENLASVDSSGLATWLEGQSGPALPNTALPPPALVLVLPSTWWAMVPNFARWFGLSSAKVLIVDARDALEEGEPQPDEGAPERALLALEPLLWSERVETQAALNQAIERACRELSAQARGAWRWLPPPTQFLPPAPPGPWITLQGESLYYMSSCLCAPALALGVGRTPRAACIL